MNDSIGFGSFLDAVGIILTVLTIGITAVGAWVAVVTTHLKPKILQELRMDLERQQAKIATRMSLMDVAIDAICSDLEGQTLRERLYAISQVARLGTGSHTEIEKALMTMEALGLGVADLLPYAERFRAADSWSPENETRYRAVLKAISRKSKANNRETVSTEPPPSIDAK